MKEKVKAIIFDFKDAGWSVQKVEKELGFSNGSLGKPISDYRFCKLLELHKKEIKKNPTVTQELKDKIAENNLPENKERILKERNTISKIKTEYPLTSNDMINGVDAIKDKISVFEEEIKNLGTSPLAKKRKTFCELQIKELQLMIKKC